MPEFQLLRAEIALGGDKDTTVVRNRHTPLLFPELLMLQYLHGEDAVFDVAVLGTALMSNDEARQRLVTIYGDDNVKQVFPGAQPRLPWMDPSVPMCDRPVYVPRPTLPDNPDPRLRPLDSFALQGPAQPGPVIDADPEPTAEEIAAHAQDDEDPDDLGLVPPRVEDLPHTRQSFQGHARTARRTPDHLPDVTGATTPPPGRAKPSPGMARNAGR